MVLLKWILIQNGVYTNIVTPPSSPSINDKGLVEDVLQQCKRSAEERKKKILESYSAAARSGPAGAMTKDDPAQEFIRQRQQEAEEDKKRLLKAYDYVSRQGAGPKQVVLEELKRYDGNPYLIFYYLHFNILSFFKFLLQSIQENWWKIHV